MHKKFTHLHVHTEFSLLDCSAKISELVLRCKELNMDSIAITDHGVMYGVIDFYKKCHENKIKPIIGCEVYVAPESRFDKGAFLESNYYHLVLLAENNTGYHNLMKLVSLGFTEGFYYKPRVDMELLNEYKEGLIALSACLGGVVPRVFLNQGYNEAQKIAVQYDELFGRGNFYLELQDHKLNEQKAVNDAIIKISEQTGIPLVVTNDSHYIYKEDYKSHDILLCIQTNKTVDEPNRMKYEGAEFYLKSPDEMYEIFPYAKQALENTAVIADRCNVEIKFHEQKLPKYQCPAGKSASEYFRELCLDGLKTRYDVNDEIMARLEYEMNVIEKMGFVDYFLIVWDFIKYARDNGISVGPGRGSAAGSVVSYALRITDIDPLKYDLLFERFLNPERVSMPDIDIDFCYERRSEVIEYVNKKYGESHVAQIITFGTLAARAAIKDVGRALAIPYAEADKISKMIPMELGITLKRSLQVNPELYKMYKEIPDVKELYDMAMKLEGLPRHASTHAAGIVICEDEVSSYVPLNTNDGVITTQFSMNTLEELGLLKMDFLGLRTLTVIENAVNEIKRNRGIDIDISKIDYSDPKVYDLIQHAKTDGVFQLESSGMKQFMKELKPETFEDIIAGVALYRPGPMDFIPKYIKGKASKGSIEYTHESLRPILDKTYGCIVYQEQVMQIVRDLAGYSLGRSDIVRRAMSKKKADVMAKEKEYFIYGADGVPGCIKNGIPKDKAEKIFDEMTDFAKYAFNKSHAAAYALLAYQTAYLKTYYPAEFMAATLSSVMDFAAKAAEYVLTAKQMNVELLQPDINESYAHFSVTGDKIRFGLAGVKNVGKAAVNAIVIERRKNGKFSSMSEFIHRMDSKELNKRMLESLIKAGAFDCFGGRRSQYFAMYKPVLEGIANEKKRVMDGQMNLFEMLAPEDGKNRIYEDDLPDIEEFAHNEFIQFEKEVLGIYLSGHPLAPYVDILSRNTSAKTTDFIGDFDNAYEQLIKYDNQKVIVGGLINGITTRYTKQNRAMAFLELEDMYGFIEIIVFPDVYDKYRHLIEKDSVIIVNGVLNVSEDGVVKVKSTSLKALSEIDDTSKLASYGIIIPKQNKTVTLYDIQELLSRFKGNIPVYIQDEHKGMTYKADRKFFVNNDLSLQSELKNLLGNENVIIKWGSNNNGK